MDRTIKCPVCGKNGIPDFHRENVVCSCCDTDLSIYKLLSDYQEQPIPEKTNNRRWKIATAALAAIAIAALLLLCIPKSQNESIMLKQDISVLKDSIQKLSDKLESANQEITTLREQTSKYSEDSEDIYVVKKNDSPCKISKKIYGTESRYKDIEAIITKPLQPGDTLKIK